MALAVCVLLKMVDIKKGSCCLHAECSPVVLLSRTHDGPSEKEQAVHKPCVRSHLAPEST